LGALPQRLEVDDVAVSVHRKEGSPESLCVTYRSGMRTVREWLCFGHGGYAERKARQWWADRFGSKEAETISVQGAVTNLFTGQMIKGVTKSVTVLKRGKFYEVVGHELLVGDQVVQIGTQGE
jgi:DNA repair protein RadD